ncbi:hypothetical protein P167DRAFT_539429, partial [Morchella conica CCBAS932]
MRHTSRSDTVLGRKRYRRISGITNRTGLEYHLPIGQDDQKLRFRSVGLRLNKHLTNPKHNIPV